MRKPHKAWWADKRNKDLATNIEGQKYALGFCKHLDMSSEAAQRVQQNTGVRFRGV